MFESWRKLFPTPTLLHAVRCILY